MFTKAFYSITEELKTIPIKRAPYILMEGGGNETMSKVSIYCSEQP